MPIAAFLLVLAASPTPARLPRIFANYREPDGGLVTIGPGIESPFLFDSASRERCRLTKAGGGWSLPGGGKISLRGDRLAWTEPSGRKRVARREEVRTEELSFEGEGARLSGTLYLPRGDGPFPAVVLVHGSGPETRAAMLQYPYFLAAHGIAALAYDKRGAGRSTGSWQPWEAGIEVLAGDVRAAVASLRGHARIRREQVGVLGISNGAWVAVHAAVTTPEVAFVVPISGAGVPLWRSELFRVRNDLHRKGYPAAEIDEAVNWLARLYTPSVLDDPDPVHGATRLANLLDEARSRRWFPDTPVAPFGALPSAQLYELGRRSWRNELAFDPAADLRALRGPVLAVYGAADQDTPAAEEEAELKKEIAPDKLEVVDVPGAGHRLTLAGLPDASCTRFGKGLFEALGAFAKRVGGH